MTINKGVPRGWSEQVFRGGPVHRVPFGVSEDPVRERAKIKMAKRLCEYILTLDEDVEIITSGLLKKQVGETAYDGYLELAEYGLCYQDGEKGKWVFVDVPEAKELAQKYLLEDHDVRPKDRRHMMKEMPVVVEFWPGNLFRKGAEFDAGELGYMIEFGCFEEGVILTLRKPVKGFSAGRWEFKEGRFQSVKSNQSDQ